MGGDWQLEAFTDGKVAMQVAGFWMVDKLKENLGDNWGVVPLPKGPKSDRYVTPTIAVDNFVLPSNSANPEGLIALTHFLYRKEDYNMNIKEYMMDRVVTREGYEMIMKAINNWSEEVTFPQQALKMLWQPIQQIISGNKDAASAIAEVKPQIQTMLDDTFNK
jgi:ABC-type glycerol-3-phosphate transport system substrate-binding protein